MARNTGELDRHAFNFDIQVVASREMDDESRFRWSISGGIAIGLCLFLTWLYASWLLKGIVVIVLILGRVYLLPWRAWERIKLRGNQKEIRDFNIAIAGLTILFLVLVVVIMLQDLHWGPALLR